MEMAAESEGLTEAVMEVVTGSAAMGSVAAAESVATGSEVEAVAEVGSAAAAGLAALGLEVEAG